MKSHLRWTRASRQLHQVQLIVIEIAILVTSTAWVVYFVVSEVKKYIR